MRLFAELYERLDRTTSTNSKVAALAAYFAAAPAEDAAWALFFLTGQRLKRLLPSAALRTWAEHASGVPGWLIDESHEAVGDAAETIALVVDLTYGGAAGSRCSPVHLDRGPHPAAAHRVSGRAGARRRRVVARSRSAAAIPADEAADGGVPRRRIAHARRPRARGGGRRAARGHRPSADGAMAAVR